ncbi:MAG: 2-hydroxycarboxylate transporter family protein [Pantoea sp.]
MAGGVGEGAIPLTMGYSQIPGINQGELLAQVMPSILVGYLTAVILAGLLANLGKHKPHLTGNGILQRVATDEGETAKEAPIVAGTSAFAAAAMTALTLYLTGMLMHELLHWPAPVVMLFIALAMKLCYLISPRLQAGSGIVYRFALTAMAFPILFTFSLTITPWQSLMAGFVPADLITIFSTVVAMVLGGYFSARFVSLYPVEAGIIASTHSGMGGAGDIAILTTSHRLSLMPFAQIATRTGGALNVAFALIAINFFHG